MITCRNKTAQCASNQSQKNCFPTKADKNAQDIALHTDTCRPLHQTKYGGNKYFLTIENTPDRYTVPGLLNSRDEVFGLVLDRIACLERNSAARVKTVRSDNAKEFTEMKK